MAGEILHEDRASLTPAILDRHRAISTLMEELEAIDWYDQRIAVAEDAELKQILGHNRDEEKEHASMLLEWIRRQDQTFDGHMRDFLFSQGSIREKAGQGEAGTGGPAAKGDGSLSIGSLRG